MVARNKLNVENKVLTKHSRSRNKPQSNGENGVMTKRPEHLMSHRDIEKRRRDRMNHCLAELSKLIPQEYMKKEKGRIEKTEIIEMAIRHTKYLTELCRTNGLLNARKGSALADFQLGATTLRETTQNVDEKVKHRKIGYEECISESAHFILEADCTWTKDKLTYELINHLRYRSGALFTDKSEVFANAEYASVYAFTCPDPLLHNLNGGNSVLAPANEGNIFGAPYGSLWGSTTGADHQLLTNSLPVSLNSRSTLNPMRLSPTANDLEHHQTPDLHYATLKINKDLFAHSEYSSENSDYHIVSDEEPLSLCIRKKDILSNGECSKYNIRPSQQVPIFALNSAGGFYVPLSVNRSLLESTNGIIDIIPNNLLLHPITISVNFQDSSSTLYPKPVIFNKCNNSNIIQPIPQRPWNWNPNICGIPLSNS